MVDDKKEKQEQPTVDNDLGKFPRYMNLVGDVFSFSHLDATTAGRRFHSSCEFLGAIDQVARLIAVSQLSQQDKTTLVHLLGEEREVISFSVISRNGVIAI